MHRKLIIIHTILIIMNAVHHCHHIRERIISINQEETMSHNDHIIKEEHTRINLITGADRHAGVCNRTVGHQETIMEVINQTILVHRIIRTIHQVVPSAITQNNAVLGNVGPTTKPVTNVTSLGIIPINADLDLFRQTNDGHVLSTEGV